MNAPVEPPDDGLAQVLKATAILVFGMCGIVVGGFLAFVYITPEFFSDTVQGLEGRGEQRHAVWLFVIQLVTLFGVGAGFLLYLSRRVAQKGRQKAEDHR